MNQKFQLNFNIRDHFGLLNSLLLAVILVSYSKFTRAETANSVLPKGALSDELKSPWKPIFVSILSNKMDAIKNEGGVLTEERLRLLYQFHDGTKVGVQAAIAYNIPGHNQSQADKYGHPKDLALIAKKGGFDFLGSGASEDLLEFRLYLPSSSESKSKETLATWFGYSTLNYKITNSAWTNVTTLNPTITSKPYSDSDINPNVADFYLQNSMFYKINNSIKPYIALDYYVQWENLSGLNRKSEEFGPEIGINWSANRSTDLTIDLEQSREISKPKDSERSAFRDDETILRLLLIYSFAS